MALLKKRQMQQKGPTNKRSNCQDEVSGNMADNDEESDAEPTLYDIQNMLEELQKSVSSILKENTILRED